ncbi:MAG: hypothetical protein U0804_24490 [Gemmataceae bacterium]
MTRLLPALVFAAAGCSAAMPYRSPVPAPVEGAFEKADEVTLYSLDPDSAYGRVPEGAAKDAEVFHKSVVLGKTAVTSAAVRTSLFDAFRAGVNDHDGSVAACFIPRHGLRVRTGDKTVDLVICFECAQVAVYENGKAVGQNVLISRSPRGAFNKALKDAGVPLAKGSE